MTRRLLLQGLLLSLWNKAAGAAHCLTGRLRATGEGLALTASQPTSEPPPTLSREETESLLALGEALVQDRALDPDERRYLAEHIEDWAMSIPDQRAHYRTAVRLLDRLAGKPFSGLDMADRIQLLNRHRLGARAVPIGQDPEPIAADARMIRSRVIPTLIEGYWGSPAGWAAVGYQTFPGRCGDLNRYTHPEA